MVVPTDSPPTKISAAGVLVTRHRGRNREPLELPE